MQEYSTFIAAAYRFLRVTGAMVLSIIIPTLIEAIPQVDLEPEHRAVVSLILIPTLTALDKAARDKGWYGTSL